MSRYIDADVLLNQLNKKIPEPGKMRYMEGFNDAIARVRSIISSSSTVNVVPREEVKKIFEEIERTLDNYHSACMPVGQIEPYTYYEGGLGEAIAELKKKYIPEVE